MPDSRDPALEAALNEARWAYESNIVRQIDAGGTVDRGKAIADVFAIAEAYTYCSLGAGTPEAVAALRALVRTTMRMYGEGREHIENVCHCAAHLARAGGEFARLATPTEEGR